MSSEPKKRILLIDAVAWTAAHPTQDPLRNVGGWFLPHLTRNPAVEVQVLSAEAALDPFPDSSIDGVVISGSPRDAWSDDPVNLALCQLILRCQASQVPLLGVCYGHQVLGRAVGGNVARHPAGWELGNVPISLTPAGQTSKLFTGFPSSFDALQSHADAVLSIPSSCKLLATGSHTQVQAFSCDDLLYGVQFHPETRPDILRFLWGPRREIWRPKIGFDLDARLDSLQPAPQSSRVIDNFINHIVP